MANKEQERIYLEWFLNEAGIVCQSIEYSEPPDFYLISNGKRIAVEMTNIHCEPNPGRKGSKLKQQESHRINWLNSLSKSYYESNDIPIWVQVLLPSPDSYQNVENDILLRTLFNASRELNLFQQKKYCVETKPGLAKLFVLRLPNNMKNFSSWSFQNNEFGIEVVITEDHIRNAVNKKETKSQQYRTGCDEVWLLIVADPSYQSGMLRFSSQNLKLPNHKFDAIWLLEYLDKAHKLMG